MRFFGRGSLVGGKKLELFESNFGHTSDWNCEKRGISSSAETTAPGYTPSPGAPFVC